MVKIDIISGVLCFSKATGQDDDIGIEKDRWKLNPKKPLAMLATFFMN